LPIKKEINQSIHTIKQPLLTTNLLNKSTMSTGTKRKADSLEESPLKPETVGFYTKHTPDKIMTGVDENMFRLCASVAGQIYNSNKAEDFQLSIGNIKADVLHFEDHAPLEEVTPNFVVAKSGSTLILGWQGSSSTADWFSNFSFSPILSNRWSNVSKEIRVHGGFAAIIENELALLETTIVKMMEEHKITEVIMTGHSLGGALAQVAQLFVQAALHNESSTWSQYKKNFAPGFAVRNIAFSAPSSICSIASSPVSPETTNFLKEVATNSCNTIFYMDIVPRLLGQLSFVKLALENLIDGVDSRKLFRSLNIPAAAARFFDLQEMATDALDTTKEKLEAEIKVLQKFKHYGNIIYYESDVSEPVVYRDFNHDKASSAKNFADLEWEPQDVSMNLVGNFGLHDHNHTVRGPGLAYNIFDEEPRTACYMMDEVEITKGVDVGSPIPFTDFSDCVKKAKEAMHNASYAAVAVWDGSQTGKEKFENPGKLYIKKNVPGTSEAAGVRKAGRRNRDVYSKAVFWRNACLADWTEKGLSAANIHNGVMELKMS